MTWPVFLIAPDHAREMMNAMRIGHASVSNVTKTDCANEFYKMLQKSPLKFKWYKIALGE